MSTATTRRGFVKGAALGAAAIAGMGAISAAGADELEEVGLEEEIAAGAQSDRVDTYTHATDVWSKALLEGEDFETALQFIADSSHYFYINRATPYYGNYTQFPETGFDTSWRSPLNGRNYRGPYYDPISRSTLWAASSPNGGINVSVGSYWGLVPPNTDLDLSNHELEGYEPSENWTMVSYNYTGQTAENIKREGRCSMLIDASLISNYGLPEGWQDRNVLDVELKVRKYVQRKIMPQEYYDGLMPTTISWSVEGVWPFCEGWGSDAGDDQFRTIPQFWGCATGDDAALNFTTDEERQAYIERANADEDLLEALSGIFTYFYYDIMQIINIVQDIGMDFEQDEGKINGLDMDHDGMLDRDANGDLILQNAYGVENMALLPDWAYELNYHEPWWITTDENFNTIIINPEGKQVIGAEEDGTPIVEG